MGFPIFQSLERGKDIPQPIEIDIGKCLRFCRSVYCLTQKDVADQIGVPLQTLRQYEQGKGHIPCYMLWTLSNLNKRHNTTITTFSGVKTKYCQEKMMRKKTTKKKTKSKSNGK